MWNIKHHAYINSNHWCMYNSIQLIFEKSFRLFWTSASWSNKFTRVKMLKSTAVITHSSFVTLEQKVRLAALWDAILQCAWFYAFHKNYAQNQCRVIKKCLSNKCTHTRGAADGAFINDTYADLTRDVRHACGRTWSAGSKRSLLIYCVSAVWFIERASNCVCNANAIMF